MTLWRSIASKRLRGSVEPWGAGALAGPVTIECPPVVRALETIVDHAAEAQLHAAMRTAVFQCADLPRGVAKKDDIHSMEANRHRFEPQFPGGKHGMPVIEFWPVTGFDARRIETLAIGHDPGFLTKTPMHDSTPDHWEVVKNLLWQPFEHLSTLGG